VVSIALGLYEYGWQGIFEGLAIVIAIVIITIITAANGYIKEKQFQQLQAKADVSDVLVMRNGKLKTISSEDLVVGDIIYI